MHLRRRQSKIDQGRSRKGAPRPPNYRVLVRAGVHVEAQPGSRVNSPWLRPNSWVVTKTTACSCTTCASGLVPPAQERATARGGFQFLPACSVHDTTTGSRLSCSPVVCPMFQTSPSRRRQPRAASSAGSSFAGQLPSGRNARIDSLPRLFPSKRPVEHSHWPILSLLPWTARCQVADATL